MNSCCSGSLECDLAVIGLKIVDNYFVTIIDYLLVLSNGESKSKIYHVFGDNKLECKKQGINVAASYNLEI